MIMNSTTILIKNMVWIRCVKVVEDILKNESIPFHKVVFGEIHLIGELPSGEKFVLMKNLDKIGFEMIDNQTGSLIERIKQLVLKRARNEIDSETNKIKLSTYISNIVHHEYTYLSSLFSSVKGRTIENYFIEQRIEKARELLIYDQQTLSQIACELDCNSVAHLSTQFKKITGLTST